MIAYLFFVIVYKALLDWSYSRVISVAYGYMGFTHHSSFGYSLASWFIVFCFSVTEKIPVCSCHRYHYRKEDAKNPPWFSINRIVHPAFICDIVEA